MSRSQYSGMPRCHSVQVQCSHDGTPWAFDIIIVCVIVTRPVVPLGNQALLNLCKNDQRTDLFCIFGLENHAAWVGLLSIGYFFKKKGGGPSPLKSAHT